MTYLAERLGLHARRDGVVQDGQGQPVGSVHKVAKEVIRRDRDNLARHRRTKTLWAARDANGAVITEDCSTRAEAVEFVARRICGDF